MAVDRRHSYIKRKMVSWDEGGKRAGIRLDEQITEGFGVGVFRSKGGLCAQFFSTPIVETIFHLLRGGVKIIGLCI